MDQDLGTQFILSAQNAARQDVSNVRPITSYFQTVATSIRRRLPHRLTANPITDRHTRPRYPQHRRRILDGIKSITTWFTTHDDGSTPAANTCTLASHTAMNKNSSG